VPYEAVNYYGKDFRSHPVGTGPFTFVKWNEGDLLLLHKNDNYFEIDANGNKIPYLDAINFHFIANKSTEFLKFMNGELDFVSDIDASLQRSILTRDGQLQEKYAKQFHLIKGPYLNVEYLTILMDASGQHALNPLTEMKIRKAINYAINRSEMLLFLRNNRGIPAHDGMIPPSLYLQPAYPAIGYKYDPTKAIALLKEAGFENGIGLPEIVLHTTEQYQDIAIYIKDKLENIGIVLRVETVDPRILREMRVNKQTYFFRSSWIADYSDAESYLQLFYGKAGAPPNYARYQNPVYDSMFEQAVAEVDIVQRDRLFRSMDSLLMQDAPVVPLYYDEIYRFVHHDITGLEPDALNMLQLKKVQKNIISK
ncbi:MAG: ABC transporter substrate-binding protein, partial [Chitinophagales bacterium]